MLSPTPLRRQRNRVRVVVSAAQTQDEVDCGLFLYVIVSERPVVLELFAGEDEALLVGGDAFLVLDLGLDHVDGVRGFDF